MKKTITILTILLLPLFMEAQNVCYIKYTYDNSGNRVQREFFCGAPDNGGRGSQGGNNGGNSNRPAKIVQSNADKNLSDFDFLVSPNPSNGKYKVSLLQDDLIGSTLEILNASGTSIYKQKLNGKVFWIDITQYANGTYFYLKDEEQHKAKKVIKRGD